MSYDGGAGEPEEVVDGEDVVGAGSFFHGFFSSSKVIPSSFVIPTTGGSPLLTNSYCPECKGQHPQLSTPIPQLGNPSYLVACYPQA